MLVTDLDGTLLGPGGLLSARNARALETLRSRQVSIVFATGRAFRESARPLAGHLTDGGGTGRATHVIGAGGATTHDGSGTLIDARPLSARAVRACAEAINGHGHVAHLLHDESHDDHHYSMVGQGELDDATKWWIETFGLRHRWHESLPASHATTMRVSAVAHEREIAPIAGTVSGRVPNDVTLRHWPAMTSAGAGSAAPHMLEIHAAGVHKWAAAECLCARLGIAPDETVAFGDGPNDVELLAGAGLAFAMADGWEVARSAADDVAPPCREDGFAITVERLLDEGRL